MQDEKENQNCEEQNPLKEECACHESSDKCCCKHGDAPCTEEKHSENPAENAEECKCHCEEENAEDGECCCKRGQKELEELQNALVASQLEAKKNYDSFLRKAADLENFRKRVQRDMEDLRKFALQPLIEELLPALDNLEMGLEHAKKDEKCKEIVIGLEMVLGQIKKVFASFGIEEIKPLGEDFDPNFHECVANVEDENFAENKVSKIMRTGYKLNGRLVRPASVVVSKGAKK